MSRQFGPSIGRRRLLSSLAVLGTASAASGVGTWALLSDRERTTGGVTAGTLDLRVGGDGTTTLAFDGVRPGDSGVATVPVSNHGSLSGTLGLTVVDAGPASETEGVQGEAGETGDDAPVSDIDFRGCGTARVLFAPDTAFPVTVRVEGSRGGRTTTEEREVRRSDTSAVEDGERAYDVAPVEGKLVAVGVGDRTWRNPNPCANRERPGGEDESDGAAVEADEGSAALAEALTLRIGYEDAEPVDADDPLVGPVAVSRLETPTRELSDRILAPIGDGTDGSDAESEDGDDDGTAVLYVAWAVDPEPGEPVAGGSIEIELRPEVHR